MISVAGRSFLPCALAEVGYPERLRCGEVQLRLGRLVLLHAPREVSKDCEPAVTQAWVRL